MMMIIIITNYFIIVFFVDVDTSYCWVYLSSDHAFQGSFKMRPVLLQSATILLHSAMIITNFAIARVTTLL